MVFFTPAPAAERYIVYVYIDLSNFLAELRSLLGIGMFSGEARYKELAEALAFTIHKTSRLAATMTHTGRGATLHRLYCYGSHTGAERNAFAAFKTTLNALGDAEIHIVERPKKGREKGIDIKLATDMLAHAAWDNYDIAILVSGDADFEPAARRARDLGKKLYIAFYPHAVSNELLEASDGLLALPLSPENLVDARLAGALLKSFKEELLTGVKRLLEELERGSAPTHNNIENDIERAREYAEQGNLDALTNTLRELASKIEPIHRSPLTALKAGKEATHLAYKTHLYKEILEKASTTKQTGNTASPGKTPK